MMLIATKMNDHLEIPVRRTLLQMIRFGTRTIDRIGCHGTDTLILCLHNVRPEAAKDRAEQITRSASMLVPDLGQNVVGLGIRPWDGSEDLDIAFSEIIAAAARGLTNVDEPIQLSGQIAVA
jgi:hypothetical protein